MQVHAGTLDERAQVTHYCPNSPVPLYADATVRQVMDMTIGVKYSEVYADPKADIWAYAWAGGTAAPPATPGQRPYDYLVTLQKEGGHGVGFTYKTINTEVLAGGSSKRVAGARLADLTFAADLGEAWL